MKNPNANLLIAALALATPTLVGCLPPGAYFPAGGTTTGGTWATAASSSSDQPSNAVPSPTPGPATTPGPSSGPSQPGDFYQLTLPDLGWCLDAPSTAPGTFVLYRACDGSARQSWALTAAGEMRTPDGKCLDARWGSTAPGTPLWIWECNGGPAQQFRPHGNGLLGPGNMCPGTGGDTTAGWAPAILRSCQPSTTPAPPPPPPPPPPPRWSADPDVASACDFAFASRAGEHACLDAVAHYRYHPANVIRACDFATREEAYALRCITSGGQASFNMADTIGACDFATSSDPGLAACAAAAVALRGSPPDVVRSCDFATASDAAVAACVAAAAWLDGDVPERVRTCDFSTGSDDELVACLQRASHRR